MGPSPVASRAAELGIEVLRPESLNDDGLRDAVASLAPDCCPVVAYGGLVPPWLLEVPEIWVGQSALLSAPSLAGCAPVQHAIYTATTSQERRRSSSPKAWTQARSSAASPRPSGRGTRQEHYSTRLADVGADLLVQTLDGIETGELLAAQQPTDGVSMAPKLTPADARIRWTDPALAIDRRVRACTREPGAWTRWSGARLGVLGVLAGSGDAGGGGAGLAAGVLRVTKRAVFVGTGSVPIELAQVRPAGGKVMGAADWARGARVPDGERFE